MIYVIIIVILCCYLHYDLLGCSPAALYHRQGAVGGVICRIAWREYLQECFYMGRRFCPSPYGVFYWAQDLIGWNLARIYSGGRLEFTYQYAKYVKFGWTMGLAVVTPLRLSREPLGGRIGGRSVRRHMFRQQPSRGPSVKFPRGRYLKRCRFSRGPIVSGGPQIISEGGFTMDYDTWLEMTKYSVGVILFCLPLGIRAEDPQIKVQIQDLVKINGLSVIVMDSFRSTKGQQLCHPGITEYTILIKEFVIALATRTSVSVVGYSFGGVSALAALSDISILISGTYETPAALGPRDTPLMRALAFHREKICQRKSARLPISSSGSTAGLAIRKAPTPGPNNIAPVIAPQNLKLRENLGGLVLISPPTCLARALLGLDTDLDHQTLRRFSKKRVLGNRNSGGGVWVECANYIPTGLFSSRMNRALFFDSSHSKNRLKLIRELEIWNAVNFLPSMVIPTLIISSKDDPIVPFVSLPFLQTISRNPLLLYAIMDRGGHANFYTGENRQVLVIHSHQVGGRNRGLFE